MLAIGNRLKTLLLRHHIRANSRPDNAQGRHAPWKIADTHTRRGMNPPSRSIDNRKIRYLPVAQFHHVYPLFHADQILEILGPQQQKAHNDSSFHRADWRGKGSNELREKSKL